MFTNKQKRLIGKGFFTIIKETERYMEILSNNTKHCWIIFKNSEYADVPITLYHKHWKTQSVMRAVESIKQHDRYCLDNKQKGHSYKDK